MSQSKMILEYLQQGNSINLFQSIEMFGCAALSQRIGGLKREGYDIVTTMVKTKSGGKAASYRLAS